MAGKRAKKTPEKKASKSRSKTSKKKPSKAKKGEQKRPSFLWRAFKVLLVGGLLAFILGVAALAGVFEFYSQDLPEILDRDDYKPKQITRVYSKNGQLIDELVAPDGRRTVVDFEAIAPHMRDAILAAEDADFYRHQGLDYLGMVRALYYAVRYDRLQGASTITQQVVKNLILTPERTMKRKIQEIMLARQLEEHLDKRDIHYIYLNQIYFGHGNYGVEEAARFYFNKPAADLSLSESAALAGLVQSPERLSPFKHPKRSVERRRYVLEQMWQKGFISEAEARTAAQAPLKVVRARDRAPWLDRAPYYTSHVARLLARRYPDEEIAAMGLRVTTSLDTRKQSLAQKALKRGLRDLDARKGRYKPLRRLKKPRQIAKHRANNKARSARGLKGQVVYEALVTAVTKDTIKVAIGNTTGTVAPEPISRINPEGKPLGEIYKSGDVLLVMTDNTQTPHAKGVSFTFAPGAQAGIVSIDVKTRHVEALVGGYDFKTTSFNRATQARRQTGSAFKPIVYGAALKERISTPATIWDDAPTPFIMPGGEKWSPKNADGRFKGPLTMRKALAKSRNVIAVRILEKLTVPKAQAFARDMGIQSPLVDNYTMALGSSELTVLETTAAFATLADAGRRAEPIFIVSIRDSYGQLIHQTRTERTQALPEDVTFLLTDLMTSVVTEGTAAKVGRQLGRHAAGKTGTTNKGRDAWFMGFTRQKVTGVWVGNDDNTPMGKGVSGGSTAAPIWLGYMKPAHKGLPNLDFEKPTLGIVDVVIDPRNGLLASDDHKPRRKEFFLTGTAPTEFATEEDENTVNDFLLGQGEKEDEE